MGKTGIMARLGCLFKGNEDKRRAESEALRRAHRRRCQNFRLLLGANNRALEVMSDMEECLAGARTFGAGTVRAQCTRVASEVFQIVRNLGELAPGGYDGLMPRFRDIQSRINDEVLGGPAPVGDGPLVLSMEEMGLEHMDEVGGKMARLGEIARRTGLRVPPGFAVTASGFARFMSQDGLQTEIDRRIQSAGAERLDSLFELSSSLRQLIIQAPLPREMELEMAARLVDLKKSHGPGLHLAVRSSAVGEDALGASFAGQYHTELGVDPDDMVRAYKEVAAAKFGVTAMAYRLSRGIRDEDVPMCVGCVAMAEALSSGVAYTSDPLGGGDELVVSAVWGLPKSVVDGSESSDEFRMARSPLALVSSKVAQKPVMYVQNPVEGVDRIVVPASEAVLPALDDDQLMELGGMALELEDLFGGPQDIEWAVDASRRFTILQCRPLAMGAGPDKDWKGDADKDRPEPPADWVLISGGTAASKGAAWGVVYAARKEADLLSFPDGAVLVVDRSLPVWAPLLPRAAAVVAEHGSVAGHLANVAREYGVPALFGAKDALRRLNGQGEVTVNADLGLVLSGRRDEFLVREERPDNLMLGSPVHDMLSRAAAHIVPLNLVDPTADDFTPAGCMTLHDMTRFCHEKAVLEMFEAGSRLPLPRHASKRLVVEVPMQYWVINLDDGFKSEVKGKFVGLELIASRPMMALWKGMTAVPWAGPPPPDAKGFMTVLAESTLNPDLDPALESGFTARNYFMISSDFCSLQSRFGYHFSTVEALVGDDEAANYASFRFKGGAADLSRRVLRARLVEDALCRYGFRCEVRQDALFARVEGCSAPDMETCLVVLGHVIIHTRQLDMVMADPAERARRLEILMADLARIAGPPA